MSGVVGLSYPEPGVAWVTLEDRASRNGFSEPFVRGLLDAFAQIAASPDTRAVVVTGYDSYFCSGGTKEELLTLQAGEGTFDALGFYRVLLDCEVPTIAAMQGHAIGGGLAFGCYADAMVMAEEAVYCANFMKYGFTPGVGATHIIPLKLGHVLGTEMLMTARTYRGAELRARGVPAQVVGKAAVASTALGLARDLAAKPGPSLRLLKAQLVAPVRAALPGVVAKEIENHAITFRLPEVKTRIEHSFGA